MKLVLAKAKDEEGIIRLYKQFNEDRISSGVGDAEYKFLKGEMPWARTLQEDDCFTIIAKEGEIIIGFITIWIPEFNPFSKTGRLGEVDLEVVDRKIRRKGIGATLYRTAERKLKSQGVSHILLNVKVGNVPAMIFWTKMGFTKVSDTKFKRLDGTMEKTLYMLKKIG